MTDQKPTDQRTAVAVIANTVLQKDMQEVLRKSLPEGVSIERFTQATVAALKHKPEVFEDCDRASVYNAIVEAARDGLIPDGKQGALAPFNTKVGNNYVRKCQWMIMPEGILDKLAKQGVTAYAVSVYENDEIRVWYDDKGQHVEHEPVVFGNRGDRVGAYACGHTKGGVTYVEAMSMEDLEVPKRATKQKDKNGVLFGPWVDVPDRMEQKSCLHRLCKRIPNVEIKDDPEFRDNDRPGITVLPREAERRQPYDRPRGLQAVVDAVATPVTDQVPAAETPAAGSPTPEIF